MEQPKPKREMTEIERIVAARNLLNEVILNREKEELLRRDSILAGKKEFNEWNEKLWDSPPEKLKEKEKDEETS